MEKRTVIFVRNRDSISHIQHGNITVHRLKLASGLLRSRVSSLGTLCSCILLRTGDIKDGHGLGPPQTLGVCVGIGCRGRLWEVGHAATVLFLNCEILVKQCR